MASSKIKGITIEIGENTTKLGKALDGVDKQSKSLQQELMGVNSLLKLDPKNVELLKQKQDLLTQSITETEQKQKLLQETLKQIDSGKVEVTKEQYRDLQREIVYTDQKLEELTLNKGSKPCHIDGLGWVAESGLKERTTISYYKKYTGTSSSIVTALNTIGVNSSFSYRSKIATKNNITNYKGTASQNTKMVKLLKQGKLIKV